SFLRFDARGARRGAWNGARTSVASLLLWGARSANGTEQALQDPCSPARVGEGTVARHGNATGGQLARGLLETLTADDARRELLHIEKREGEPGESVSLHIKIELPSIVVAPSGQNDMLQWLCPLQEHPQSFRKTGSSIDVLLRDTGELATKAGQAGNPQRP